MERAHDLVAGDRERQHGDKLENHGNIAALWDAYLRRAAYMKHRLHVPPGTIGPEDAASMMELLKVARRLAGDFNIDDAIDGAGYAAVYGEIASRTHNRPTGEPDGREKTRP